MDGNTIDISSAISSVISGWRILLALSLSFITNGLIYCWFLNLPSTDRYRFILIPCCGVIACGLSILLFELLVFGLTIATALVIFLHFVLHIMSLIGLLWVWVLVRIYCPHCDKCIQTYENWKCGGCGVVLTGNILEPIDIQACTLEVGMVKRES